MTAAAGTAGILMALLASVALTVQGFRGQRRPEMVGREELKLPVWAMLAGAVVALATLEVALLRDDFSIAYVAGNHARATPLLFTIVSAWAALEGSIVLWGLVLAGYTATVLVGVRDGDRLGAGALAVLGLVGVFFFGLMSTVANPFEVVSPVPADGPGPNALLQNHLLMAVHPPLLYLGYVGLTVPFAFAVSALLLGHGGTAWLARTRHWSLTAWTFLTAGIVVGGWWSYEVLGWGGFWAWDPVENASLLPWLVATAFIHSAAVQLARGTLQAWNVVLVISAWALTILGTFLTRSGVIASVHSFTQSAIGPALLGFLLVMVVGALGLFALRADLISTRPRVDTLVSREGALLVNNLLLAVFAVVVLTGTLAPILVEASTGSQVSVGRPFFDRMTTPLALTLLLAMGIGPVLPWRAARLGLVWERLRWVAVAALAAGAALVVAGRREPSVVGVVILAVAVWAAIAERLAATLRHTRVRRWPAGLWRALRGNPGYWGGMVSHAGVALVAVAITLYGALGVRTEVTLTPGDPVPAGPFTLTLTEVFERSEPHRQVRGARIELRGDDRLVHVLEPRLHQYPRQTQPVGSPAVWTGLDQDVYVSLTRLEPDQATVQISRFPLLWLLWTGGLLVAIGGVPAAASRAAGRRQRRETPDATTVQRDPAPVELPAVGQGADRD